jgi:hypothetical protein
MKCCLIIFRVAIIAQSDECCKQAITLLTVRAGF